MADQNSTGPQYLTFMSPRTSSESANPDSPAYLTDASRRMDSRSKICRILLDGHISVMANIVLFLPTYVNEDQEDYQARVEMASLRNYFAQAVTTMLAKIFAQSPRLKDDVPKEIQQDLEDADLNGNHWTIVAKEYLKHAVAEGISWMVCDFTKLADKAELGNLTIADEKALGVRPYWVVVPQSRVLGVKYRREGNSYVLTQFRFIQYVDEDYGEFGTKVVEVIRVYEPNRVRSYKKDDKGGWELEVGGDVPNTLGRVPAVPLILDPTGQFEGKPPLENLSYMNREHFQIRSDQRRALSVASYPMLVTTGVTATPGQTVKIGPMTSIMLEDHNATVKWVESQGAHLREGAAELAKLEADMRTFGLAFQNAQMYATATGRNIDASDAVAPIQLWAQQCKDALEIVLMIHAMWRKQKDGGSIDFNTAFLKDQITVEGLKLLVEAFKEGALSREGFLSRMKDYGLLSDDFDISKDIDLTDAIAEAAAKLVQDAPAPAKQVPPDAQNPDPDA